MTVLYPVFALFALTMFCIFRLGYSRYRAVRERTVDHRFFRSYEGYEEPEELRVQSRHVVNLLEVPVLFYAIAVIAHLTDSADAAVVALCWMYVLLRYLHSYVHLTSNRVLIRFRVFGASLVVLTAAWTLVFARLVFG